jgi:hypothetical protein
MNHVQGKTKNTMNIFIISKITKIIKKHHTWFAV